MVQLLLVLLTLAIGIRVHDNQDQWQDIYSLVPYDIQNHPCTAEPNHGSDRRMVFVLFRHTTTTLLCLGQDSVEIECIRH